MTHVTRKFRVDRRLYPPLAWAAVLTLTLLLTACDQESSLTAPEQVEPAFLISDGAHGGNEHFFFLTPMVPAASPEGVFDDSLEPVVEICELDNHEDCGASIAIFNTLTGPGSETVRVSSVNEQYVVNWHTDDFLLDDGATYRIAVYLGNQQLGFADVDVVSSGKDLKNVATGEFIGLLDGRTLPIKFRIEEGALSGSDIVSAGGSHSCIVAASGAAYCSGYNYSGQLGNGGTSGTSTPTAVIGGHVFQSIATGVAHTCGVTTAGEAYCWGYNWYGQLGTGTRSAGPPYGSATPLLVSGGHTWQAIAPGHQQTCGLTTDSEVYCWGYNGNGALGRGYVSYLDPSDLVPGPVVGGERFKSVRAAAYHSCGVTEEGEGRCWGYNYYGQVGNGTATPNWAVPAPVPVSGDHHFLSIDPGGSHTCGVTTEGGALCWGQNDAGQVGNGTYVSQFPYAETTPSVVAGGYVFRLVRAGTTMSCGVTTSGAAMCWGSNPDGRLGSGSVTTTLPYGELSPVAVAGGYTFTQLDTGGGHTCGVTVSGPVVCWGFNYEGQLGDGTLLLRDTPTLSLFDPTS